jgi:hypothetical protein
MLPIMHWASAAAVVALAMAAAARAARQMVWWQTARGAARNVPQKLHGASNIYCFREAGAASIVRQGKRLYSALHCYGVLSNGDAFSLKYRQTSSTGWTSTQFHRIR